MGIDPIARSGHLTDLGLEALVLEGLENEPRQRALRHLRRCKSCQARLTPLGAVPADFSARTTRWWGPMVGGLALAAAGLLYLSLDPPVPDFTRRGGSDGLEIWVHNDGDPYQLAAGGTVNQGERIGFRVGLSEPAYVMVLAIDEQGDRAEIYPGAGTGAGWLDPSQTYDLLPVAVRLDNSEGGEFFHGVVCPHDFTAEQAFTMIADGITGSCMVLSQSVSRAVP